MQSVFFPDDSLFIKIPQNDIESRIVYLDEILVLHMHVQNIWLYGLRKSLRN